MTVCSPDETFKIAKELSGSLISPGSPVLVGLSGELGAGKTTFASGFASGLGVKGIIASPTFLGISEDYSGKYPFIHMDFYKKVVTREIIESYLKNKSFVLIEWIENFNSVFGIDLHANIRVYIQYIRNKENIILENERKITIDRMIY